MLPLLPGMMTDVGRVLGVSDHEVLLWSHLTNEVMVVPADDPVPDLEDRATYWLALEYLGERVGLDPTGGLLWSLGATDIEEDGAAWILEDQDEVRTRPADTADPIEALRRALEETAPKAKPTE